MHVYAQFSFLWKSTKFKKIQVQFLEHREVIRPCTKNKSCSTFFRLSFKLKKARKNAYAYSWRHFVKKSKIIFFSPPGGARKLKLRSFDSESKITSDCRNFSISKKITLDCFFFIPPSVLIHEIPKKFGIILWLRDFF